MDTDEMVRMAKELSERGWKVQEVSDDDDEAYYLADNEYANLGDIVFPSDADFIAHAPRTILALAEEVARLQARCAELERDSLGGLHSPDESPPVAYANEENKRFRFESCEQVEAIVKMPLTKQMRFGRGNWEGRTEIEWQGGNSPFFGFRIEHEQVVGWRPLPAPQPSPDQP